MTKSEQVYTLTLTADQMRESYHGIHSQELSLIMILKRRLNLYLGHEETHLKFGPTPKEELNEVRAQLTSSLGRMKFATTTFLEPIGLEGVWPRDDNGSPYTDTVKILKNEMQKFCEHFNIEEKNHGPE